MINKWGLPTEQCYELLSYVKESYEKLHDFWVTIRRFVFQCLRYIYVQNFIAIPGAYPKKLPLPMYLFDEYCKTYYHRYVAKNID